MSGTSRNSEISRSQKQYKAVLKAAERDQLFALGWLALKYGIRQESGLTDVENLAPI